MYHMSFIHASTDGHLVVHPRLLDIVKSAISIGVLNFLLLAVQPSVVPLLGTVRGKHLILFGLKSVSMYPQS